MRLPYAPASPPSSASPETHSTYAAVSARRAPRPLQPLDLALLHAPPIANGWNSFLGAIRTKGTLPAAVRELAICRVAMLNGASYEWAHHVPLLKDAGVGGDGIEAVKTAKVLERTEDAEAEQDGSDKDVAKKEKREGEGLDEKMWAVLDYTDQMTRGVRVEENVFARLKTLFDEREVVEITATVAAYNCVSRFLVALDVGEGNAKEFE